MTVKTKNLEHHKTLFLVFFFSPKTNGEKIEFFYFIKISKISSCWVIVVSNRESREAVMEAPLPHQRSFRHFPKGITAKKRAVFIKSGAIISSFMMITSLLKKTTTF